jgi:gluconolactonase
MKVPTSDSKLLRLLGCLVCLSLLPAVPLAADEQEPIPGIGPVGEIEKVRGEFRFTEGPAWNARDNSLYFTDIPAQRIYRLHDAGKFSVFLEPSRHANGLMFDAAGTLYACEMDGRVVAIDVQTKDISVLADEYDRKRFNAPNDLVIDRAGGVYFTDPHFRAPEPLPQGTTAVYYIDPDGEVTRLIDDLQAPNGVLLSPDEKTLYVVPTLQKEMMAYRIEAPGRIGKGRVFCTLKQSPAGRVPGGDGLTVDTEGNLYITSELGVQVFNPEGDLLGVIRFPEQPANVTFGGEDLQTLYVTARTSLYSAKMEAKGHAFPGKAR